MAIPVVTFCYQVLHSLKTFKGVQVIWGKKTYPELSLLLKGIFRPWARQPLFVVSLLSIESVTFLLPSHRFILSYTECFMQQIVHYVSNFLNKLFIFLNYKT